MSWVVYNVLLAYNALDAVKHEKLSGAQFQIISYLIDKTPASDLMDFD